MFKHLSGSTYHKRIGGPDNVFRYAVDYVLIDPTKQPLPKLISRNQFNIASLHDRDHGGIRGDGTGVEWVKDILEKNDLHSLKKMQVLLLAQPRILGYVFNPVSFWLIMDDNKNLRAVIVEVNNTFGDRHSYLCHHDTLDPIKPTDTMRSEKVFHVSPFQPVAGQYSFNFDVSDDRISIRIILRHDEGGVVATLEGFLKPLTSLGIVKVVIQRPIGSLRVLFLIHYQAVKLWFKRASFRSRPEPPRSEISK